MRPVSAGGFLEAEQGARLLVDSSLAAQVVPGVLHILLNDTAWERSRRGLPPENPDPSEAKVAISNSRVVSPGSLSSVKRIFVPVT